MFELSPEDLTHLRMRVRMECGVTCLESTSRLALKWKWRPCSWNLEQWNPLFNQWSHSHSSTWMRASAARVVCHCRLAVQTASSSRLTPNCRCLKAMAVFWLGVACEVPRAMTRRRRTLWWLTTTSVLQPFSGRTRRASPSSSRLALVLEVETSCLPSKTQMLVPLQRMQISDLQNVAVKVLARIPSITRPQRIQRHLQQPWPAPHSPRHQPQPPQLLWNPAKSQLKMTVEILNARRQTVPVAKVVVWMPRAHPCGMCTRVPASKIEIDASEPEALTARRVGSTRRRIQASADFADL